MLALGVVKHVGNPQEAEFENQCSKDVTIEPILSGSSDDGDADGEFDGKFNDYYTK